MTATIVREENIGKVSLSDFSVKVCFSASVITLSLIQCLVFLVKTLEEISSNYGRIHFMVIAKLFGNSGSLG